HHAGRRRGDRDPAARAQPRAPHDGDGDASRRHHALADLDPRLGLPVAGRLPVSGADRAAAGHDDRDALHLRQLQRQPAQSASAAGARRLGAEHVGRDGRSLDSTGAAPRGGVRGVERGCPTQAARPGPGDLHQAAAGAPRRSAPPRRGRDDLSRGAPARRRDRPFPTVARAEPRFGADAVQPRLRARASRPARRSDSTVPRGVAPRSRLRAGSQQPGGDAAAGRTQRRGARALSPCAGAAARQRRGAEEPRAAAVAAGQGGRGDRRVRTGSQRECRRRAGAERPRLDPCHRRRPGAAAARPGGGACRARDRRNRPSRPGGARCPGGGVCRRRPVRRRGRNRPNGSQSGDRGRPRRCRRPIQGAAHALSATRGLPSPEISESFRPSSLAPLRPFAFPPFRLPAFQPSSLPAFSSDPFFCNRATTRRPPAAFSLAISPTGGGSVWPPYRSSTSIALRRSMAMARNCGMARSALLAIVWIAALPALASAQSAIAGTVRDTSGAVLPGVTVEASSPVLIEKVRSVVSNDQGQFTITDLRPGTYRVTFALPGFSTFVRDGLELSTNFTATINAEMRVGALEENVTVTGASPVVDVSSTSKVQVMSRDVLDALPTGRSIFSMGQLVTGVSLNVPDVGGARAMQQTYMSTRGLTSANNIVQVDGLMINGLDGDGAVQQYINNAMIQEMSYQTAGAGADISPGGIRVNIIPRDGGNRFSGSFFGAWSDGGWQADNLTPELLARGLRAVDRIEHIYDFNVGEGGPIKKDKLWFFASARKWSVNAPIADTFYVPAGSTQAQCQSGAVSCEQGVDDQKIKSAMFRVTWQISPRNKFSAYYDEIDKFRGHGMNAGDDPATASQVWTSPAYNDGAIKWTSTVTNRMMLDAGFSMNQEQYVIQNQDGINKPFGSPEWIAGAMRRDSALITRRNGIGSGQGGRYPDRYNMQGAVSYVTGAHNFKTGVQYNWGPYVNTRETNGDLEQFYLNGVPSTVTIYNTPLRSKEALVADVGIYAQDSWTLKRMTVNGGLRFEYLNSEVSAQESGAGRFVGERKFDAIPMPVRSEE